MAGKGKSDQGMEEEKLREEAMAEWLSRGLDIEDFSMAKMMSRWMILSYSTRGFLMGSHFSCT